MTKSNRRRKQDKAKRQSAAVQRNLTTERRRLATAAERRGALLTDPQTPPAVVARLIRDLYGAEPVIPGLARMLEIHRGSPESVAAVAAALRDLEAGEGGSPSLAALTFGAQAAGLCGDHAAAAVLMDQALARSAGPEPQLRLAGHLRALGRTADGIELLARHLDHPAYGEVATITHGATLEDAHSHLSGQEPQGSCSCGSGSSWSACCRGREAAALERFADRTGLYELRTALVEFLPGSAYEKSVAVHIAESLEYRAADPWEPGLLEPLQRLAVEHAWITAGRRGPDDIGSDDQAGAGDTDNLLTALADDPTTPAAVRARALAWRDHVRYGLWQVADPTPSPGLWCTEVCTAQDLYVAFAPEQVQGLPRWGVLLGAVVPLDGAWRATGAMIRLSPDEGDALCETIRAAVEAFVDELVGRPRTASFRRMEQAPPFGRAEPHGVYACWEDEPAAPEITTLTGRIVGVLVPRLVAEVTTARATPPGLSNTDGEPLCMITARVAIRDGAAAAARLGAHPDFETHEDGELTWLGRELPAAQRIAMLAEARAQLLAEGYAGDDLELPDEPNRWVLGQLTLRGEELRAEVNSARRLERLLDVLAEIGAEPDLLEQARVDPAQDLPWPAGHRPVGGGLAAPDDGWERQWLDEPVPALRGRTPRQAAADADERPLLEGLLRQFEYDADLLVQDGRRGADTRWLREHLDMPSD